MAPHFDPLINPADSHRLKAVDAMQRSNGAFFGNPVLQICSIQEGGRDHHKHQANDGNPHVLEHPSDHHSFTRGTFPPLGSNLCSIRSTAIQAFHSPPTSSLCESAALGSRSESRGFLQPATLDEAYTEVSSIWEPSQKLNIGDCSWCSADVLDGDYEKSRISLAGAASESCWRKPSPPTSDDSP